jgi:hypothetical protein
MAERLLNAQQPVINISFEKWPAQVWIDSECAAPSEPRSLVVSEPDSPVLVAVSFISSVPYPSKISMKMFGEGACTNQHLAEMILNGKTRKGGRWFTTSAGARIT